MLIISLEDPLSHVDNHLKVLDWNPENGLFHSHCDQAGRHPSREPAGDRAGNQGQPNLKLIIATRSRR